MGVCLKTAEILPKVTGFMQKSWRDITWPMNVWEEGRWSEMSSNLKTLAGSILSVLADAPPVYLYWEQPLPWLVF